MAKFQLLNPVLRVVGQKYDEEGIPVGEINKNIQNAGNKYLYSQLINLDCPWEGTQTYTSFQKPVVAIFEPLLSMQHGGIGQTDQAIPEMFQTIEGCYVSWKSPQPFYKKHLSAHPANPAKGTPAIMAGDIVKQGGVPVIYTELVVFCQYYYDSRGEKQWMRGSTPEEVGRAAFSNYCIPANDTRALAAEQPQQQETIGGQTINTVNPNQQPQQQETIGGQTINTVNPNQQPQQQAQPQQAQPQFVQGPAQQQGAAFGA